MVVTPDRRTDSTTAWHSDLLAPMNLSIQRCFPAPAASSGNFGPPLDLVTDAHDVDVGSTDGRFDAHEIGHAQPVGPRPVQWLEIRVDILVVRDPDDPDAGMFHEGGNETALVAVFAETDQQHAIGAVSHGFSV